MESLDDLLPTQNPQPQSINMTSPSHLLTRSRSRKVPLPTWDFWIIKILCTTIGETCADAITTAFNGGDPTNTLAEGPTCGIMSAILVVALCVQITLPKYFPVMYWLVVVLLSVVGTLITDNLVDNLNVELWQTTVGFSAALVLAFLGWYFVERTLSIHSITTLRREIFYWLVVLFTFALGTSAGDQMTFDVLQGVYWQGVVVFASVIAIDAIVYYGVTWWKPEVADAVSVPAFWIAYVVTRPLGASIGDLLSQTTDSGGAGLGAAVTSGIFLALIGVVLGYICYREWKPVNPVNVVDSERKGIV
ncbi:hypothetical protein HDU98_006265 [Podochytrium sp. JEL0797]|nr:hypothetical protein HDU98_006265 [Podochytrium sp. JEL0797]